MTETAVRPAIWKSEEKHRVVCPECQEGVDICFNTDRQMVVAPHNLMPKSMPKATVRAKLTTPSCFGSNHPADGLEIFESPPYE